MLHVRPRRAALLAITLLAALAFANRAGAAGAVDISTCQTLSGFATVYRLTTDLSSCGPCLIVANNRITIDLQGHSITRTQDTSCGPGQAAITDQGVSRDLIVVRNGTVSGYDLGVDLERSTRASVLGVKANVLGTTAAGSVGITVGPLGLVKGSEASSTLARNDAVGIRIVGSRGQVQQNNVHNNGHIGIQAIGADNCLITANIVSSNGTGIVVANTNKCTISFNTANDNERFGIVAGSGFGTGHLVTGNVALNNNVVLSDGNHSLVECPTVTNNRLHQRIPSLIRSFGQRLQDLEQSVIRTPGLRRARDCRAERGWPRASGQPGVGAFVKATSDRALGTRSTISIRRSARRRRFAPRGGRRCGWCAAPAAHEPELEAEAVHLEHGRLVRRLAREHARRAPAHRRDRGSCARRCLAPPRRAGRGRRPRRRGLHPVHGGEAADPVEIDDLEPPEGKPRGRSRPRPVDAASDSARARPGRRRQGRAGPPRSA